MNFALFEDTLNPDQARSYLFTQPFAEICLYSSATLNAGLAQLSEWQAQGYYLAGYLAYEASSALYPQLSAAALPDDSAPLLHFIAYRTLEQFCSKDLDKYLSKAGINLPTETKLAFDCIHLAINLPEYQRRFNEVYQHLELGDTYQLNLTTPVSLSGNLADLFAVYYQLSRSHPVAYAAYLPFSPQTIISQSPELFFNKRGNKITVRPMKGTVKRGQNENEDRALCAWLRSDPKNQAENLIIVDLLRNDLAKFCDTGSVQVQQLFAIEEYASIFQMTSTIQATLNPKLEFAKIIQHLFPSGSISGAPKLRTLELIRKIEAGPRGIYTGALGYILPNNDMQFNVAIRTLSANPAKPRQLILGVGGGITVQTTAEDEWAELNTKLNFVTQFYQPDFKLVESMLLHNGLLKNRPEHLTRLANSAGQLKFGCNLALISLKIDSYLQQTSWTDNTNYKFRLQLAADGEVVLKHSVISTVAPQSDRLRIALLKQTIDTTHPLFRHKTNSDITRGLYTHLDAKFKPSGIDELVFMNQNGIITEGRFFNLIIELGGKLLTSPQEQGLLGGIFRQNLIKQQQVTEQPLTKAMLQRAQRIFLCNDVRGLIPCDWYGEVG